MGPDAMPSPEQGQRVLPTLSPAHPGHETAAGDALHCILRSAILKLQKGSLSYGLSLSIKTVINCFYRVIIQIQ
jgi:hypothetical protein